MMPALLILIATQTQSAPTATGSINGHVLEDGSNKPVVAARVMLLPQPGRPMTGPPPQTTTDADGAFAFASLAPGDYRLDVQKTGFVPSNYLQPGTRAAMPRPFHVEAGQPTAVDVHLRKGAIVTGRVLDMNGEPLADARVMALRRMDAGPAARGGMAPRLVPAPGQGQQTNDIGEFRVSGLPPGQYIIAASPRVTLPFGASGGAPPADAGARTTIATTYYPGTTDPDGAQLISVAAGETVNGIQFTMQSSVAFRVSGIVVDESGQPVAGAMVMLMGDPRSGPMGMLGPGGGARTNENGRFTIVDVVPGSYRINASVPMTMTSGSGGGLTSFSSSSSPAIPPTEVVVSDANVGGLRVVTRRPGQ